MTEGATANSLHAEKSPYLLQHSANPVYWYPWGEEAFQRARNEDKPIFLSIGYSTCHWCHVMAHESFEDPEIAEMLNKGFISIKVDREERPDIDHFYMAVCQAMTGGGGWPLTIIMTPDREPFFSGTYIPRNARYGMIGMNELLPQVLKLWTDQRERIMYAATEIISHLKKNDHGSSDGHAGPEDLQVMFRDLSRSFDEDEGGFGQAPKFPSPHNLLFLLRQWKRTGEPHALEMVEHTLKQMRGGGMYDQIGFGFHRYSTDRSWLVPHFEKMLYDQALLMMAYTEAYQVTGDQQYRTTVSEIADYVSRELTSPDGGFYSAEDADSEGEEGKFYLWKLDELKRVLHPTEVDITVRLLSMEEKGNFTDPHRKTGHGNNIPHLDISIMELLSKDDIMARELRRSLKKIQSKLFTVREERIHPGKDDKVLTDWNGLMIAAFAKAYRVIGDERYLEMAVSAERFVMDRLRDGDGRLLHRYRDGDADVAGNIDDHAFFVWGLIELYESTFDAMYLEKAMDFANMMIDHFHDPTTGGFFFSSDEEHELPVRRKEYYDGAIPSGNSTVVIDLIRISRMTGDPHYEEIAGKVLDSGASDFKRHPGGFVNMMNALDMALGQSQEIVISGDPDDTATKALLDVVRSEYLPNSVVILNPMRENSGDDDQVNEGISRIQDLAPYLAGYEMMDEKPTAYVCRQFACQRPTKDPDELRRVLTESSE